MRGLAPSVHTKTNCRNIRELPVTRSDSSQNPSVTPLIRGLLRNPLVCQLVKKSVDIFGTRIYYCVDENPP